MSVCVRVYLCVCVCTSVCVCLPPSLSHVTHTSLSAHCATVRFAQFFTFCQIRTSVLADISQGTTAFIHLMPLYYEQVVRASL